MIETKYDLAGPGGIRVWTNLPEGVKLTLTNGDVAQVVENARDGGYILCKFLESPQNPARVGQEEYVFFNEVRSASD